MKIRGVVHAYEKGAPQSGEVQIDKARWVEGPVQEFEERDVARGAVLAYAEGRVRLEVLALYPADSEDGYEYKILCGVIEPSSTRRAFKLLRKLPWWEWKYAPEPAQA